MPLHRLLVRVSAGFLLGMTLGMALPARAAAGGSEPVDPDQAFHAHLAAARLDPDHADFRRLRIAFAKTSRYNPDGPTSLDTSLVESELKNGERAAALVALDRVLIDHWTEIPAHDYAINVCERTGSVRRAAVHHAFLRGLACSILDSGDGKTPGTAWQVTSEAEAQVVLHALHATAEGRSLLDHDGVPIEVVTACQRDSGQRMHYHFNMEIPDRWRADRARDRLEDAAP